MGDQPEPKTGMRDVFPTAMHQFELTAHNQYEAGKAKYGTVLQTHNARDAGADCMQELVDAVQYLTQLRIENCDAQLLISRWVARMPELRKEAEDAGFTFSK
jgi:hypothetical protein